MDIYYSAPSFINTCRAFFVSLYCVTNYPNLCAEWPEKVRTPSILFIHNQILLKSALKNTEKLYEI